jgi:D-sedoheptulose 7-phosphate isomerase
MPLEHHIHSRFVASLALQRDAIEQLAEPLARAAELIVASLMREGKILAGAQGGSIVGARLFASLLANGHRQDRPGLAAAALDAAGHSLADVTDMAAALARQVECLGHPGDVLLAISDTGEAPGVLAALRHAHTGGLDVVLLTVGDGGQLAEELRENDVVICTPRFAAADTRELHLRAIHCLCDGIDYLLLGA